MKAAQGEHPSPTLAAHAGASSPARGMPRAVFLPTHHSQAFSDSWGQ